METPADTQTEETESAALTDMLNKDRDDADEASAAAEAYRNAIDDLDGARVCTQP